MIRGNYNITFLQQMLGISSPMSPMSKLSVSSLSSPEVQNQLKAAGIDVNSRQYQVVMKDMMGALDGRAGYTTVSAIKNRMRQYNADGDYVGPGGIVVPGMIATGIPESERHQIINVSEDARQKMFDETKRHFLQEYGVANGDTTKRSEVFRAFQLSIPKEDRLKGTWTLGQYERAYTRAFVDAVKAVNPNWEPGQPFDKSILDSVTRESVDHALVKSGNKLVFSNKSVNIRI
ncbi:hypothetical protein C814_00698 [Anaerotruncus sp. G3(2012)]|uniref:DUF3879 family protein n=1 Tax=Anaerotruncus sp. G3(2012) TaxID=1235835 RepID=UPI00033C2308|nr:DUF3879 family protein [Anaerotruncus sp. G3(2012)]EOS63964.1 hypothetical protein C814_00698 [Anaerotruncus sp. G3(2012)]